jgi:small conductance mechanosensitive channel
MNFNMNPDQLLRLSELWTDKAITFGTKAVSALVIFILFWIGAMFIRSIFFKIGAKDRARQEAFQLLGRTFKIGLIIFGSITALGTMGMDVTALVTGLGLTGLALGLATKDPLTHAVCGILIILYRPVRIGEEIEVNGVMGKVTDIDLRCVTLMKDNQIIMVPNAQILSSTVKIIHNL